MGVLLCRGDIPNFKFWRRRLLTVDLITRDYSRHPLKESLSTPILIFPTYLETFLLPKTIPIGDLLTLTFPRFFLRAHVQTEL